MSERRKVKPTRRTTVLVLDIQVSRRFAGTLTPVSYKRTQALDTVPCNSKNIESTLEDRQSVPMEHRQVSLV